jgi:hypothetical protein
LWYRLGQAEQSIADGDADVLDAAVLISVRTASQNFAPSPPSPADDRRPPMTADETLLGDHLLIPADARTLASRAARGGRAG